jgi:hypothetical protein
MNKHYRLSVPMKPETKEALEVLAACTNSSAGSTAGSFLDELAPHFITLAEAYAAVRVDPLKAARIVNQMAARAVQGLDEEQLQLLDHIEKIGAK